MTLSFLVSDLAPQALMLTLPVLLKKNLSRTARTRLELDCSARLLEC
jgi:hypothetical protein